MKRITEIGIIIIGLMLTACAQPKLSASKAQYQTKANQILGKYSNGVSRGFIKGSTSGRGFASLGGYDTSGWDSGFGTPNWDTNPTVNSMTSQNNSALVLQNAMSQEVQYCVELFQNIPANCGNYPFMVASMTRCLDRILTYRNPLLTFAYRNLDTRGQQYWTYLLSNQAAPIQQFSLSQYQGLNQFATMGLGFGGLE